MKNIFSILLLILLGGTITAQQDPQYTQYMYNTISVNPGYAGSRGALTVGGLHRSQWVGIQGAPTTQTLFIHSPVFNEKVGLGFSAVNDKIGPINQTFLYGDFAYHLKLVGNLKLGMGIKAGVNMFQPKIATLETAQANDPSFVNTTMRRTVAPNVGGGLYLYSDKFYVGVSSPKMLQNKLRTGDSTQSNILEKRHLFLIAGLIIKANESVKIKPTLLVKATQGAPVSMDATVEALFNDKWSIGVAHRWKESVSGLFGVNITQQFRAGFAYDYTLTKLQKYNSGSFEIMLMYDFITKKDKLKSPRYF
ncbi:MAG: rane protein [Bacteroidetes bacterium]|jgi:type IX secretion system PorP/SprF family membrane protein|nr:rane protein [Bacteroidota bacterium]